MVTIQKIVVKSVLIVSPHVVALVGEFVVSMVVLVSSLHIYITAWAAFIWAICCPCLNS